MDYKQLIKFNKLMCINFIIMPYKNRIKKKIKRMTVQRLKKLNKDIEKQHTPPPEDPKKIDFKNYDEKGRLNL